MSRSPSSLGRSPLLGRLGSTLTPRARRRCRRRHGPASRDRGPHRFAIEAQSARWYRAAPVAVALAKDDQAPSALPRGSLRWPWPLRPWSWRRCSSRPNAASKLPWIAASTDAGTTRPRASRRSPAACGEQVDLDTLSTELLAVVDQTMEPTRVSLWFRPSPHGSSGTARSAPRPNYLDLLSPQSAPPAAANKAAQVSKHLSDGPLAATSAARND
jgi:hypothetical protein